MTLIAFHGSQFEKDAVLAKLRDYAAAGVIVKGRYWHNGRGCAVGCLTRDPNGGHASYERLFGIPEMLARLEDFLFEALPLNESRVWPLRFMDAIKPGSDLNRVGWQFLHWLILDLSAQPFAISVLKALKQTAEVIEPATCGFPIDKGAAEAAEAAVYAVQAADATRIARRAATDAAVHDVCVAARAAVYAVQAATAKAAACNVCFAARAAAEAAGWGAAEATAAWAAACTKMSDRLIELLEAA